MNKTFLVTLLVNLFTLCCSDGQKSFHPIINDFFQVYENEGVEIAIDNLFSKSKWLTQNQEQINTLKQDLTNIEKQLGEYHGYESIAKKTLNNNLELHTILVKYDRQPIRFVFILYNPDGNWRVQNFHYDSKLIDELENSAKIDKLSY